jgi:predicted outer membrane repeat protein
VRHVPLIVLLLSWSCAGEPEPEDKPDTGSPADTEDPPAGSTPQDPPVDNDADGFTSEEDCDDDDPSVFPGAPELCGDGVRHDCDRSSEDGLVTLDGAQGFDDLQAALDAAVSGSELLLCPGQYAGNFVADVPVSLVSLEGAELTAIDGAGSGSALAIPGDSSLAGLTLKGGQAAQGGGLRLTSAGTLLLQDCAVTDNRAGTGGGLAIYPGASVTLVNTTVSGNTASEDGGGIYVGEGGSVELGDSVVSGNVADGSGGGVALQGASLSGGTVSGNASTAAGAMVLWTCGGPWGGGIYATGDSAITGTDVWGNQGVMGGGLGIVEGRTVATDVLVHGHPDAILGGSGISVCSGELELLGASEIYENVSAMSGAGLYAWDSLVEGGLFRDNVAGWIGGGAIVSQSQLVGAVLQGNQADHGGGAGLWDGALRQCTVTGNVAATHGGGIDVSGEESEYPTVVSASTVADNSAPVGAALTVSGAALTVELSSIWRNNSPAGGAITLERGGELQVIDSDLGTDADDNLPVDLWLEYGPVYSFGYGSFSCDTTECR